MEPNTCEKEHSEYKHVFDVLPYDQAGGGRHACCGCAYEKGKELGEKAKGEENFNLHDELVKLNRSQKNSAGSRHKSTKCAFFIGYLVGQKVVKDTLEFVKCI